MYQIEESMEANSRTIIAKNKDLAGLREEQRVHNEALDAARAEQAKVRTTAMQKEKGIKKADKALEDKVRIPYFYLGTLNHILVFVGQKPDLVATETQIIHSTRKINNVTKTKEEVARSEEKLAEKVNMLEKELASVRKAADAAQGRFIFADSGFLGSDLGHRGITQGRTT